MYKIILVDDHLLFREGLKLWIETEGIGTVIAEASNGFELIDKLHTLTPDLVILDVAMPLLDGIDTTKLAITMQPEIKILGLTMLNDLNKYVEMTLAGATGFMLKTSGMAEIKNAIHAVVKGESYFSEDLVQLKKSDLKFLLNI